MNSRLRSLTFTITCTVSKLKVNRNASTLLLLFCALLTFIPLATVYAASEESDAASTVTEKRPLEPMDLWRMSRVGSPELSPDGKQIVFPVTTWDIEEEKSNSDLWIVPVDGSAEPRRLTWRDGGDSSPRWSPDGKSILFTSKRGDQKVSQLHLLPMSGGEARPLTDIPITPSDPHWSSDGKKIFFIGKTWPDLNDDWEAIQKRIDENKKNTVQEKITNTRLVRYWDHYLTDGRVYHFFVLDVETGEVKDLTPNKDWLLPFWGAGGSWDLSPDDQWIAFTQNSTAPPYQTLNFDVYLMPSSGGEATNITADNKAYDGSPRFSPDGKSIYYSRNRRPSIAPDFNRMARYDIASKKSRELLKGFDAQPSTPQFSQDGKSLLFHAQDSGNTHVYELELNKDKPKALTDWGVTSGVAQNQNGVTVYQKQTIQQPYELFALMPDGTEKQLTSINQERLENLELGSYESITYKGADGDDVQMWVVKPPNFDPNKKWPLLVLVHGGPHGAWNNLFHYRWNAALFASRGHVVVGPNFHGSTGRGQAFAESILGNHAEKPFEDVMKATDYMIKTGYIDEARMATAGGSYGGYMVSWILGHTDRYKAIVNHAGVYDLMAQFSSDYTWGRPNNYGAAPWVDPERIDLYSPSRYAKNFNTPTLIIHGELDYRVPYTHALNMHQVLTGKGVPSRLVIFPNENHWILKPKASQLWWDEFFNWVEKYTGKGPTP